MVDLTFYDKKKDSCYIKLHPRNCCSALWLDEVAESGRDKEIQPMTCKKINTQCTGTKSCQNELDRDECWLEENLIRKKINQMLRRN